MGIFDTAASTSPGSVPVYGYAIAVAHWTAAGEATDEIGSGLPTYGAFVIDARLRFADAVIGSSVTGPSTAHISAAFGQPVTPLSVEECGSVIKRGDRVLIGVYTDADRTAEAIRWIWAGYCVRLQLTIGERRESASWRLIGPEWVWGGERGAGSIHPVMGQPRRTATADEAWLTNHSAISGYDDWSTSWAEPTIFNPGGRANMTVADVRLGGTDGDPRYGRIFETPDRTQAGTRIADKWTVAKAAKFLGNYLGYTGGMAFDFATAGLPDTILRNVSVDGFGLWAALARVLSPDWAFYVDPTPSGMAWGGFQVRFFSRNTGDAADLPLAPRGTLRTDADAAVTRLDLTSDITKTVCKVKGAGQRLYHISLRYRGDDTTAGAALTLQHGWSKADGRLSDYQGDEVGKFPSGYTKKKEVTEFTIQKAGKQDEWRRRYTSTGRDFEKYRHVFRLFTWNEAGEVWTAGGGSGAALPEYGTAAAPNTPAEKPFWVPDVAPIFGDDAGTAFRRRRPLRDTQYRDPAKVDEFRRTRPILLMAYKKKDGTVSEWFKVPGGKYQIDPERAAVWITEHDLAMWCPFDREQNQDFGLPNDDRTFATMLHQGVMRLALEGCIDGDDPWLADPAAAADGGSPVILRVWQRFGPEFTKISAYAGDDGFIYAGDAVALDDSADALAVATQMLSAGKDAQVHTSIMVAADWPKQTIGKTVATIAGRDISLLAGQGALSGRPAQIVALRMDAETNKWEVMTESAALALKRDVRLAEHSQQAIAAARRRSEQRAPGAPNQGQLNQ